MNRFDLEEQIMQAWNIVDDLRLLSENEEDCTPQNLEAVALVYDLKFARLFRTFEFLVANGLDNRNE